MDPAALHRVEAELVAYLHPAHLGDPVAGVRAALNQMLLRYDDELGGAVVAYAGERLRGELGRVLPGLPFVRAPAAATLQLFTPFVGCRLAGTVDTVGGDYLKVLVLGVFNAVIPARHIRAEFQRAAGADRWVHRGDPGHTLEEGKEVSFRVLEMTERGSYFHMTGSLMDPDLGDVCKLYPAYAAKRAALDRAREGKERAAAGERAKSGRKAGPAAAARVGTKITLGSDRGAAGAEEGQEKPKTEKKPKKKEKERKEKKKAKKEKKGKKPKKEKKEKKEKEEQPPSAGGGEVDWAKGSVKLLKKAEGQKLPKKQLFKKALKKAGIVETSPWSAQKHMADWEAALTANERVAFGKEVSLCF